jgi:hypothetical protein
MSAKPFQPGNNANPKGRRKGSVNKFTTLKAAFLNVFERTGGEDGLLEWVNASNHNKAAFYQWITKMLPADVNVGNASDADGKTQALVIKVIHTKDGDGGGNGNGNGDK